MTIEYTKEFNCGCKILASSSGNTIIASDIHMCPLHKHAGELVEALIKAKECIKIWHGEEGWSIYNNYSPEMKQINQALAKVEGT